MGFTPAELALALVAIAPGLGEPAGASPNRRLPNRRFSHPFHSLVGGVGGAQYVEVDHRLEPL